MFKTIKRSSIVCLSFLLAILMLAPNLAFAQTQTTASDNALSWLKGQIDPSTGAVASFEGGNVAYTYDQAVAVIAFLTKGDLTDAKTVLNTLQSRQVAHGTQAGAFHNAYYLTGGVQENTMNVGPTVWVAMAVMAYEKKTGDTTTYHNMAINALNWALQFQQADGGLNGGIDADGRTVLTWASTEHNLDAYAALTYFGYPTQAAEVKSFLDNVVWSGDHFIGGRGDTRDPMDVNLWGVMALGINGTHPYYEGITYDDNHHLNTQTLNGISYNLYDFNSDKNDIWFEGSAFMAVADNMNGNPTGANTVISEIMKNQSANGGIQYSLLGTNNGYWTMSNQRCVSSTGWLILAIANYNPFQ